MHATSSGDPQVLLEWNADHDMVRTDPGKFVACLLEVSRRDVFEDLGTKHNIEAASREVEGPDITRDAMHARCVNYRFRQIERDHFLEPVGKEARDVAVASSNLEYASSGRKQLKKAGNSGLFVR